MTTGVPSGDPVRPPAVGVVVVDDSAAQRRFLRALIDSDSDLSVVGEARTGKEAVALVERLRPAVVIMDLDLPVMTGIEAIERIMATRPTPILAYSTCGERADDPDGLAALAAGAVDVLAKPSPDEGTDLDSYAAALRRRVRVASRVRVITHPRGRLRPAAGAGGPALATPLGSPLATPVDPAPAGAVDGPGSRVPRSRHRALSRDIGRDRTFELVAIGVSTGGPHALALLLGQLPADFEQAVVVVQHMADGFLEGLASWLDSQCALPVRVGENGKRLQPGTVTIAPGGRNLLVHERLRVTCEPPPPTQFHIPGIDATFTSIAANVGASAIGVILTGMGRDGAAGLKVMRERGAVTVGQDEATSAVYGMPGAAMALGAVEFEHPLEEIAPFLLSLVRPDAARRAP